MARPQRLQPTPSAGKGPTRDSSASRPPRFIYTWLTGYDKALAEALDAAKRRERLVLLRLASQPMPDHAFFLKVLEHGWRFLAVPNRFRDEFTEADLSAAVDKALDQAFEAFPSGPALYPFEGPGFARKREAREPRLPESPNSNTPYLTPDERRDILRAVYGTDDDDGVR